jgi:hypothetical protein
MQPTFAIIEQSAIKNQAMKERQFGQAKIFAKTVA